MKVRPAGVADDGGAGEAAEGGRPETTRVVSLIPAATEIVHALGRGNGLVGRSHECDRPPGVVELPSVTEPKYEADGTSYGIDESVKALLQEGLSVYRVDAEALDRLRPDVVVTQDQCEVCAVSLAEVERAVRELVQSNPTVVSLAPTQLADILDDVRRVAEVLDVSVQARERVVDEIVHSLEAVTEALGGSVRRPDVAVVEWLEPLMAAGNWIPELVEVAGGRPLFGRAGAHSPWMEWDDLRAADPEVVIVVPCGFTIDRTAEEMELLTDRPGWSDLRAVREERVYVADGHHFFNRPGPRIGETAEILAEILHPDLFEPRHEGSGWVRPERLRAR